MTDLHTKITAEDAAMRLLRYGWMLAEGYWRPHVAAVGDRPEIIPGNYTLEEAIKFYGYVVEQD